MSGSGLEMSRDGHSSQPEIPNTRFVFINFYAAAGVAVVCEMHLIQGSVNLALRGFPLKGGNNH